MKTIVKFLFIALLSVFLSSCSFTRKAPTLPGDHKADKCIRKGVVQKGDKSLMADKAKIRLFKKKK
ncbi:MAG: hypothetical protein KC516_02075 [Nanoarchaeota archaeon]|nr:hypothetical protein [Nanoarchaeota archaeon]